MCASLTLETAPGYTSVSVHCIPCPRPAAGSPWGPEISPQTTVSVLLRCPRETTTAHQTLSYWDAPEARAENFQATARQARLASQARQPRPVGAQHLRRGL